MIPESAEVRSPAPSVDRHTNAAGVEFVTVACPVCGFRHAHKTALASSDPGSPSESEASE